MTLYTQVASNRRKTFWFFSFYALLLLALGWAVSVYYNSSAILIFASVWVIIQGLVSLRYSDVIALTVSRAVPLDQRQYNNVYKIVENLTITAGLPMPSLYLIDDTAMNAFATGRDKDHASIAVTSGLVSRLNDNELAGVLAHELSHVGNEDIRLMSMVMIMAGIISLVSDLFLRNLFWGGGRNRDNNDSNGAIMIIAIVLAILAPIAAALIQLAISRKREFMADADGALLTRYPEGLISALKKISGDTEPLEVANKATAHMYFSNPLHSGYFTKLFSTHPPIEERIEALAKGSGLQV